MNVKDIPARHVLTLLSFCGFFIMYALRVNMSVAIVAMVRRPVVAGGPSGSTDHDTCRELSTINLTAPSNKTNSVDGEFSWDSTIRGQVLASFFYGYIVTQIPGGVIADKYGAKWIFGIGMLIASVFTLLTPVAARWNIWALIIARGIMGLGEGAVLPASKTLISRWAPKMERSRMSTCVVLGINVGNAVTLIISGVLCDSGFLGGWPSVFYVFGTIGCIWFVLWTWLVYESPETHPRISKKELAFILNGQDQRSKTKPRVPWKSILTSVPVWALCFTHMCHIWGYYTILIELPSYLSSILHFNLRSNGVLSALPQVMFCLCSILASVIADRLRTRGDLSITSIRKLSNSVSFFGAAVCLLIVAFSGCRPVLIVALLTLTMGALGCTVSGFSTTHVDMSPDFAGVLYGITNFFACLSGFLVPIYVGWLMQEGQTVHRWSIVFITASVLYLVSGVVYAVFSSSELQSWAKVPNIPKSGDEMTEMTNAKDSEAK